jgi:r-opsin
MQISSVFTILILRLVPEGFLTSCSFDYLTDTFDNHTFVVVIFICSYVIPMIMIIYFYSQIVSKVFSHEKALREQVRDSLFSQKI